MIRTATYYPAGAGDREVHFARFTVVSMLLFVIILGGAAIGLRGAVAGMLVAGAVAALLLVFVPAHVSVWMLLTTLLLVMGPLTYFAGMKKALWIPHFMTVLLTVRVLLELPKLGERGASGQPIPAFIFGLWVFVALFVVSAMLNRTDMFGSFVASKTYVFVWAVTFLIGLGALSEQSLEKIWKFFLWVGVIQLPFAVVERVFYARRSGIFNWDAVVGTFGGNPEGGGASGGMALFLVFSMLLASKLYSARSISAKFHWTVIGCALGTIALAEVKIVFFILPLAYAWLYRKEIPRHPGRSLMMGLLLLTVLFGIFLFYKATIYSTTYSPSEPIGATIERLVTREGKTGAYDPRTGDISRAEALSRWWALHSVSEPQLVFGHGPGASRVSETAGVGAAAAKYHFNLTMSAASQLLWELGLSGYLAFLFILLSAAYCAERMARNDLVPGMHRNILAVNGAVLLLTALLTVYNRGALEAPTQGLTAAMLGHVLWTVRSCVLATASSVSRTPNAGALDGAR